MVGIERVIKKIIIFCRCHKWITPYLPDINKSHLPFTSTEQSGDCPTQLSKTFFLEKTKCKECVNSSAKLSFCFVFLLCSFCWQLKMVINMITMIWFPLLLDSSLFGTPPPPPLYLKFKMFHPNLPLEKDGGCLLWMYEYLNDLWINLRLTFSYKLVGMTLFNKSRLHYIAAFLRNGGWLYYDGKFKSPHT